MGFCGDFYLIASIFSMKKEARLLTEKWGWKGRRCRLEDREVWNPEEQRREVGFWSSTNGPLEVKSDEIKVKLTSVIVFFFNHFQMQGCWCGVGELAWSGLWFCRAHTAMGEESTGVEVVCKGVMQWLARGLSWVRMGESGYVLWTIAATKFGNMRWCSEYKMFEIMIMMKLQSLIRLPSVIMPMGVSGWVRVGQNPWRRSQRTERSGYWEDHPHVH